MEPDHATPEDAARATLAESGAYSVQLVGVVVRGDAAVVAHVVHPPPRSDIDTARCSRAEGGWNVDDAGNGTAGYIFTCRELGHEKITLVAWQRAPEGAVAGRFSLLGREQVVPVHEGHVVVAFDDVPFLEFWPVEADFPAAWPDRPDEWIFER